MSHVSEYITLNPFKISTVHAKCADSRLCVENSGLNLIHIKTTTFLIARLSMESPLCSFFRVLFLRARMLKRDVVFPSRLNGPFCWVYECLSSLALLVNFRYCYWEVGID